MEKCVEGTGLTLNLTANVQESLLPELEGKTLALDSRELASRKRRRYIAPCTTREWSHRNDDDFQVGVYATL